MLSGYEVLGEGFPYNLEENFNPLLEAKQDFAPEDSPDQGLLLLPAHS